MILGLSEGCMGRLDVAIAEINRAIDAGYRTFLSYGYLAGAEAAKGDDAAAKLALAEARRLNPKLTTRWFAEHLIQPAPFLVDWWRKAGMPEE
jgi:predicted Zn-dependent protease